MGDDLARAALARAVGVPFHAVRDATEGQQVERLGGVFRVTPKGGLMAYNPFNTYDRHRHRHACFGGPVIYPRCSAMRDGDRCEYRQHRGTQHAAQTGGHLWIERPLGVCSICDMPVYPLMALARANVSRAERPWYASLCCENGVVVVDGQLFDQQDDEAGPDPFGSTAEWSTR